MPDDIDKLGLDVSDIIQSTAAAEKAFNAFNASIDKFTAVARKTSRDGDLIVATFDAITDAGEKAQLVITQTIKKNAQGIREAQSTIVESIKQIDKSLDVVSKSAVEASEKFQESFSEIVDSVDKNFRPKLKSAIEKVAKSLTSDGIGAGRFKDLWEKVLTGDIASVTSEAEQKLINSMRTLAKIIDAEQNRLAREAIAKQRSKDAQSISPNGLNIFSDAGLRAQATNLLATIRELVAKGEIEKKKLFQVYVDLNQNKDRVYTDERESIAKYVRAWNVLEDKQNELITTEHKRSIQSQSDLNNELLKIQKINEAEQNRIAIENEQYHNLGQAKNATLAAFPNKDASVNEKFKYNTAIGASLAPVAAGQVTLERYLAILDSIKNKRSEVFANPIERKIASDLKNAGDAYGKFGNEAKDAFGKMQKSLVDTSFEGKKASSGILLNWQSMLRLLEVQFLHVFISRVIGTFKQVTRDAIEFQKGISEIRTISQDVDQSFEQLSQGARAASLSTGFALKDITEGVYETTSNQIAKGNEAIAHIQQVGQFARTTAATMADGVNLIDGVLNAYQLDASHTAEVSAQLFKTIDLGRIRTKEIANSFGNVTSISAELGVSLEEVNASMARLTIQGIKPAVAMTLLENLMTKLIKPTGAMKDLLAEWGYESGTAAIAALGFSGVIEKMSHETENNKAKFGELFNTMRGLRGIFGITSDMDKYRDAVDKIRDSYHEYVEAQKRAQESPGFKLGQEFERIKTYLTTDFGNSAVDLIIKLTNAFGGLSKVVATGLPELIKVGVALLALKTASTVIDKYKANKDTIWAPFTKGAQEYMLVQQQARRELDALIKQQNLRLIKDQTGRAIGAFGATSPDEGEAIAKNYNKHLDAVYSKTGRVLSGIKSLGAGVTNSIVSAINPIGLTIAGITYLIESYFEHEEKLKTIRESSTAEAVQQYQKDTEAFTVSETKKIDILNELTKKQFQGVLQYLANQGQLYNKYLDELEERAQEVNESIKIAGKSLTDELQQNLTKVNSEISKAKDTIDSITKQLAADSTDKEKRNFDLGQQREGSGAAKVEAAQQRINKLYEEALFIDRKRAEAQALRETASTLTDPYQRQKVLDQAKAIDDQYSYESSRSRLKDAEELLKKINEEYVNGMNKREKLEDALNKAKVKEAGHIAAAEAEVELDALRAKQQEMLLATGLYTENELKAIKEKINSKKAEIQTLRLKFVTDEDVSRIAELVQKIEELDKLKEIDIKFGGLEGLQKELDTIFENALKKIAESEVARQQKAKQLLDAERENSVKNLKEAGDIVDKLSKVKVIDSTGKFQDFDKGKPGLKFLNDETPSGISAIINAYAFNNHITPEEEAKRLPEALGQGFADYYREQSQKILDIMRSSGASPADILKTQIAFQAKAEALQLEATERIAKKISEIYSRSFTDLRDATIEERNKTAQKITDANTKINDSSSKIKGDLTAIIETAQGSVLTRGGAFSPTFSTTDASRYPNIRTANQLYANGFSQYDKTSNKLEFDFPNALNTVNYQFNRWTGFLKAQADVNERKNALEVAQKDKTLTPDKLKEYQTSLEQARNTLSGFGNPRDIKEGYLTILQSVIDRFTDISEGRAKVGGYTWNRSTKIGSTTLGGILDDLNKQKLEAQNALNTAVNGPETLAAQEELINKSTEALNKYQSSIQDSGTSAKTASEQIPLLVLQLDAIGEAAKKAQEKIRAFNSNYPSSNFPIEKHALGGMLGSDTQMFAGTPGEMVMNRQASQDFYPLLMAMNGRVSDGLSLGGSVNVGDVNINVNGSGNARVDARAIGYELKSLIRQGLLTL